MLGSPEVTVLRFPRPIRLPPCPAIPPELAVLDAALARLSTQAQEIARENLALSAELGRSRAVWRLLASQNGALLRRERRLRLHRALLLVGLMLLALRLLGGQ
jgi:hypothetical protein